LTVSSAVIAFGYRLVNCATSFSEEGLDWIDGSWWRPKRGPICLGLESGVLVSWLRLRRGRKESGYGLAGNSVRKEARRNLLGAEEV
jgi:hypothetical protein